MAVKVKLGTGNGAEAPALTDLIDRATLQALQDVFSERHRVAAAILDEDAEPITFEHGHCAYCKEIRKTRAGYNHCRECDRMIIRTILQTGRKAWGQCDHGGLHDFAVPLRVGHRIVAFFFIGQIRAERGVKSARCLANCLQVLHDLSRQTSEEKLVSDVALKRKSDHLPIRRIDEVELLQKATIEFANGLSSALTKLVKWRKPAPVKDFVAKMRRAGNFEQLFNLCIREIPRLMGTRHCSVLTVVRGTRKAEPRLVLRRTSYAPSRRLEGGRKTEDEQPAYYALGEGLTGWVWKNKRPLRLRNIQDPMEISRYHDLGWTHKVDDSERHREWLGVPLFGRRDDVIGVIRVPQKKRTSAAGKNRPGGGFSLEDEILLMSIGQHVARRIEELQVEMQVETATQSCLQCAMDLTRATDEEHVGRILMGACEQAFGTEGRAHFFNLLGDHGETLRIASLAGKLSPAQLVGKEVPLDKSLSGAAIRQRRSKIVHDVEKAKEQRQFFPAVDGLECGMSVPMRFAQQVFGALSVGADRPYEFSEEPDLHTLEDLAHLAGSALARLEAQRQADGAFAQFTRSAGHSLHSRIATLELAIDHLKKTAAVKVTNEISALETATEFLKAAADEALRYGRAWDQPEFQRVNLVEILARLKELYQDDRLRWLLHRTPELQANPWLLEQIVVELVVNALRFAPNKTKGGEIVVKAYSGWMRSQLGKRRRAAVIEVRDNGPGVPRGQKQSIFQPYRSVEESHLGLGLSIVMRAVRAHGGLVDECGREGCGACFRVLLPTVE